MVRPGLFDLLGNPRQSKFHSLKVSVQDDCPPVIVIESSIVIGHQEGLSPYSNSGELGPADIQFAAHLFGHCCKAAYGFGGLFGGRLLTGK